MSIVSVDLAYRQYEDIGLCVLNSAGISIGVKFLPFPGGDDIPEPERAVDSCIDICMEHDAQLLLLDGPQAWKHPDHGTHFARSCEQALRTPAKTGLPGSVTPRTYSLFVEFAIAVFDVLDQRGWPRLSVGKPPHGGRPLAVETFPNAAWRTLGISPLPAKSKARPADVTNALAQLREMFNLNVVGSPTHDDLQALVSGLAGVALERGDTTAYHLAGHPPIKHEGIWREGFIITPLPSPLFSHS